MSKLPTTTITMLVGLTIVAALTASAAPVVAAETTLVMEARKQIEKTPDSGTFQTVYKDLRWSPSQTAIVICDMWNEHWCRGATRRVAEMAPRMNEVVRAARKQFWLQQF